MLPFYILLVVPIVIQHLRGQRKGLEYKQRNTLALAFFFGILTILIMFRHEDVGNDTRNYIHYFITFSNIDWERLRTVNIEFGYTFFNKVISLISKEPQLFLMVAAIAVSGMIYPTYKRLSTDASLTIVLFCTMSTFVMMFSGIRQMLAVGLGFVAYSFVRERKLLWFLAVVLIAMTFHTSAFMLFAMYPLYYARINKKWLIVVIPVMLAVFVFNNQIFGFLLGILQRFSRFDSVVGTTGAYTMIILFALFSIFSYIIPDESKLDEETIGLRNFLLFALLIQMFAPLHTLAMRMNYYYIIFIPLLIPKIIESRSERWQQVAIVSRYIMVAFFLAYFFINASSGGSLNVFPYHFFWE